MFVDCLFGIVNCASIQMADVRVEVGVDPEMANVPVILTRHFPGAEQVYEFATFNATAPNPDVFTIPAECQD